MCLGGPWPGNESISCARGSKGQLCGSCEDYYYHSRDGCTRCPSSEAGVPLTVILSAALVLVLLVSVAAHFHSELHRLGQSHHSPESAVHLLERAYRYLSAGSRRFRWLASFLALTPATFTTTLATTTKILLSYTQMLYVFRRYTRVQWPALFETFLDILDLSQLVGVESIVGKAIMPFHCMFGSVTLNFYDRMLLTLLMPFIGSGIIFTIAIIVRMCTSRRRFTSVVTWSEYMASPPIWSVHIWFVLLSYPTLCRETFAIFSCIEVRDVYLLYSDPTIICYDARWLAWSSVAAISVGVFCLGIPLGTYFQARRYHEDPIRKRRVHLLTGSYVRRMWWFGEASYIRSRSNPYSYPNTLYMYSRTASHNTQIRNTASALNCRRII